MHCIQHVHKITNAYSTNHASKKDIPQGKPYLYKLCVVTQQTNGLKKDKNVPWLVVLQLLVIPGIPKLRLHCCSYPPGDSIVQLHSTVQLLYCDHEFHYTVG